MDLLPFVIHLATLVGLYIILALSLNLTFGYTGLINLGHVALWGLGAYTSALLGLRLGWPFWFSLLAAVLLTAIISGLISLLARRLEGDQFALFTLLFHLALYVTWLNWQSLTRGALGLVGISRPEYLNNNNNYFLLVILVAIVVYLFLRHLSNSSFGRLQQATRDDELAAKTLGKNTGRVKLVTMMLAGALTGLAGALYAYFIRFIDPGSFYLPQLLLILNLVVVGGLASYRGSVFGTVLVVTVFELLRFLGVAPELVGPLRLFLFAVLLIVLIMYRPKGLLGRIQLQ